MDPNKQFDLLIVSAVLPAKPLVGDSWDALGGLPDPLFKAVSTMGAVTHSGNTPTLNDTVNPVWNAVALANVAASELKAQLRVDVFDVDVAFNDPMGGCVFALTDAAFDGVVRNGACPASATGVAFTFSYKLVAK